MEKLSVISPLIITGIFIVGFLAFLLAGFNSLLNAKIDPIKDNQARLEIEIKENQAKMDTEIKEIKEDIRAIKESLIKSNKIQTSLNK